MYMLVGASHRLDDTSKLMSHTDDNEIERVTKQKLLSAFIDEQLPWTPHIEHLSSLISSKIPLLKQLTDYVPQNIQKYITKVIFTST